MTGAFAKEAMAYHEAGCIVVPTRRNDPKEPHVKRFTKLKRQSPNTIEGWAERFPEANLGIVAGKASDITVVDVDDPGALGLAVNRFGDSPLKVATPSGGFHLLFRSSGERCSQGVDGLPIDIKGEGGLAVAPPSLRPDGGAYSRIAGCLADIKALPRIKADALPEPLLKAPNGKPSRNVTLRDWGRTQARHCDSFDDFLSVMRDRNEEFFDPLSAAEVFKTAKSVWDWTEDGNNWCGGEARAVFTRSQLDGWPSAHARAGDALLLFSRLTVAHGWRNGGAFVLANAFRETLGWSLRRFQDTRGQLEHLGVIECLHRGGSGPNDPPIYRLVKVRNLLTNSNRSPAPHSREG